MKKNVWDNDMMVGAGVLRSSGRDGSARRSGSLSRQWEQQEQRIDGDDGNLTVSDTFITSYNDELNDVNAQSWHQTVPLPWVDSSEQAWSNNMPSLMPFDTASMTEGERVLYNNGYRSDYLKGPPYYPYEYTPPQQQHTGPMINVPFQLPSNALYSNYEAAYSERIPPQLIGPPTTQRNVPSSFVNTTSENIPSSSMELSSTEKGLTSNQTSSLSVSSSSSIPTLKRRPPTSTPPRKKKIQADSNYAPKDLEGFVVVFENAPGALASVKRRKKLEAPKREAAKDVRRAGSCLQCRFRKRTEIKCQRESPFVGKPTHEYFKYSSTRRVVSFKIQIPVESLDDTTLETITVDGIGRISHTIKLQARRKPLSSFAPNIREKIERTNNSKEEVQDHSSIYILENSSSLGTELEQWALEYTSKFVHAAGPEFYSTTMAQILGTAYVKKGLAESPLVAAMLRVASLAFVLRAGIKYTPTYPSPKASSFRTIQATIDTILYQRLIMAEQTLFSMLQRLIFRTAGCLNRNQVYPVALVLWQLMRIFCIGASHLSNIIKRFQSTAFHAAESQYLSLKLLFSTHMALFRSSNPLLLDMNEKFNKDLVGGDLELIALAGKMKNVVTTFREKGCPEMRGSIVYKREFFEEFRRVCDGK
ncbi:hypothetical protein B7494_g8521 [Chlorociboria aeruginascens]|nr:hypothetical protein B7494_g8521 [Chlorociboria aeruginascens]